MFYIKIESRLLNVNLSSADTIVNYNAQMEIYSVDPSKFQNVNYKTDEYSAVFGSTAVPNGIDNANNAKHYLGIDNNKLKPLGTITLSSLYKKASPFNLYITDTVNEAVEKGKTELCLAFLNPKDYNGYDLSDVYGYSAAKGWSDGWSDVLIYYNTAKLLLTVEEKRRTIRNNY